MEIVSRCDPTVKRWQDCAARTPTGLRRRAGQRTPTPGRRVRHPASSHRGRHQKGTATKGTITVNTASNKWQRGFDGFGGGHVFKTGIEEAVHIAQGDLAKRSLDGDPSLSEADHRQAEQFMVSQSRTGVIKGAESQQGYYDQPHERHAKAVTDWVEQWSRRNKDALFKNR